MSHFDAILKGKKNPAPHWMLFLPKHSLSAADFSVTDLHNMSRRRIKGHGPKAEPQIFLVSKFKCALGLQCSSSKFRLQVPEFNCTSRSG